MSVEPAEPSNEETYPPTQPMDGSTGTDVPESSGDEGTSVGSPPVRRRWIWVAGAVVVVGLVVFALLFTGLLGPGLKLGPSGGSSPADESISFSQAFQMANASAQSQSGGPWLLVDAAGIIVPPGGSSPFPSSPTSGPCSPGGLPTIPHASASDLVQGLAPFWAISFEAANSNSTLEVSVIDRSPTAYGPFPPSVHCLGGTGRVGTLAPPSTILDSPGAVAKLGTNLTQFASAFPTSTAVLSLDDVGGEIGTVSGTAVWLVYLNPCNGSRPGDPLYLGGVNGTTDRPILSFSDPALGYCEVPGTLGTTLQLGLPTITYQGAGLVFTMPVRGLNSSLSPDQFQPRVFPVPLAQSSSDLSTAVFGFQVQNATGSILAVYNLSTRTWTSGGSTPLAAGDTLALLGTAQLEGAALVLVGVSPTNGQIGISLP